MLDAGAPNQMMEEIRCISSTDPLFEDVLRLRDQALPVKSRSRSLQDAYDEAANIYLLRKAGQAVLTVRTIHARAVWQCEMEGLYPTTIIRTHRDLVMHTSKLVRHPDVPANYGRLVRLFSFIWENEYAQGMRLCFATSPLKYLAGYRALGFAVLKDTSFSLLETADESRLIAQPALAAWRSPFTAGLDLSDTDRRGRGLHEDLLRATVTD